MLSCNLDLLSVTESWLTSHDSITIADLTNSLEDYNVYHLPRSTRTGGGPAVIARKGLHVLRNKSCVLSSFKHFDLTITSGDKVSRLVTVYRPPPSKKNGFTVKMFFFFRILCVIRGVLLCGDFNFHVDDNLNANSKTFSSFCLSVISYTSSLGTHFRIGRRDVKKPFVLWNAP